MKPEKIRPSYVQNAAAEVLAGTNCRSIEQAIKAGHISMDDWCNALHRHRDDARKTNTHIGVAWSHQ